MNNPLPRWRSLSYLLLLPVLALCVCLQVLLTSLLPQSFIAVLASLYRTPGYASYPYASSLQVTLFSSPATLYANTVPDSFILRASDGTVMQKVPEKIFAVYQDIVYTSSSDRQQPYSTVIRAIRKSDGKLLWSNLFDNLSNIQLIDGILYFNKAQIPQQQGLLQALDPASGRLLWQHQCSSQECYVDLPQVQQGVAYVKVQESAGNSLLALRTSDGSLLWQIPMYNYALKPLLAADRFLMQTARDTFTAYRLLDSRMLWQTQITPDVNADAFWVISNGSITIIRSPSTLYAIRMDNGARLWQRQDSPIDIKLSNTVLYLVESGGFTALNPISGQKMWQQAHPSWAGKFTKGAPSNQSVTILNEYNGIVYTLFKGFQNGFAADDLSAFRTADGQILWERRFTLPTAPKIPMPPDGQSFIADSDMEALLNGDSIYFTCYQVVTSVFPVHFTISLNSALSSFFNTTTFILNAQAIDGQTGSVKWHTQQVDQYHVA